jgi:ribose 5-phosphate isomerase B
VKFYIANDHAGFELKAEIVELLSERGCEVVNLGTDDRRRVDYPDLAHTLCADVLGDKGSFGILICGTGIGMSIAANRHEGIRAALCHDAYTAQMARAHNDANILCMGERVLGMGVIKSIIDAFIDTPFEDGRHSERIKKLEIR